MARLQDTEIRGNLYVSEDIQIGDISILDALALLEDNSGGNAETLREIKSDWNQNDPTKVSYIQNRPFYTTDTVIETVTAIPSQTITGFSENNEYSYKVECLASNINGQELIEFSKYDVTWDGVAYAGLECYEDTLSYGYGWKCYSIGAKNGHDENDFEKYPFKITSYFNGTNSVFEIYTSDTTSSHVIKVLGNIYEVKKLDPRFLPKEYYSVDEIDNMMNEIGGFLMEFVQSANEHFESKEDAESKLDAAEGYADSAVSTHNTSTTSHTDIRTLISDLSTKVNNFLDVDDATMDELSEVIELINNNKGTLESLTTNKINVSDIIDDLTTSLTNKVLSANQGVVLKSLIDNLETSINNLETLINNTSNSNHTHGTYYTKRMVDSKDKAIKTKLNNVSKTITEQNIDTAFNNIFGGE